MLSSGDLNKAIAVKLNIPPAQFTNDYAACQRITAAMSFKGHQLFVGWEVIDKEKLSKGAFWAQFGTGARVVAATEPMAIVCAALTTLGMDVHGSRSVPKTEA